METLVDLAFSSSCPTVIQGCNVELQKVKGNENLLACVSKYPVGALHRVHGNALNLQNLFSKGTSLHSRRMMRIAVFLLAVSLGVNQRAALIKTVSRQDILLFIYSNLSGSSLPDLMMRADDICKGYA